MRSPPHLRTAAGIAAFAGLHALALPPFGLWPLAFVSLVPLLFALQGRRPVARALIGGIAGVGVAGATVVAPLVAALTAYFDFAFATALAVALTIAVLFGGLGFALFALLAGEAGRDGLGGAPRVGLAMATSELFRSTLLGGLPWLLLGHAMAPVPELAQLARWGGVGLLSAALAASNAALFRLALPTRRPSDAIFAGGLLLLFTGAALGLPASGGVRGAGPGPAAEGALRVALVQPAVPQTWRADPARAEAIRARLASLSEAALPASIVAWPENALTVLMPANADLVARTVAAWPAETTLVLGAPRYDEARPERRYNSAFRARRDGALEVVRDKAHLVPFTESTPLGITIAGSARLSAGPRPGAFEVDGERLGVLICYEMLFRGLVADAVEDGAGVLFNLSNDGYFGSSAGAEQHLAAVVLAAVETGRPVLRATLDGSTVAIDEAGRVVARLEPGRADVLRVDVRPASAETAALRVAPGFQAAALACALLFLRREMRTTRSRPSADRDALDG
ncbi:MAG: apolipoprotein N-acyltransferase [Myxococcota bacterium]